MISYCILYQEHCKGIHHAIGIDVIPTKTKLTNMKKAADQYNYKIQLSEPPKFWHPPAKY